MNVWGSEYRTNAIVLTIVGSAVGLVAYLVKTVPFELEVSVVGFFALTLLLDRDPTDLKHQARGTTSFLVLCALAVLSGPLIAALVAALTGLVGGLQENRQFRKIAFNCAQHTIAVCGSWLVYKWSGGATPAAFLGGPENVSGLKAVLDLARFFGFVLLYLSLNSFFVSLVIASSTAKPLLEVWRGNNRGVLSFDLSSIAVSILGAISFTFFERWSGLGVLGLALVAVPMLGSRRSYLLLRQVQASGEELLELMVKAIEARDPYTSGHSVRVQRLSIAIATDLGFAGKAMEDLATAALLHDVGKIHEEFAPVLRKEGALSNAERTLIESHAERGAELVGVISRFRGSIQSAVLHHHERWDGAGYPRGLSGDSIPKISRIILVADTIDAMTTDRPYRARMNFDLVAAELRKHSGTQFDPEIAEAAVSSLAVRRIITEPDHSGRALPLRGQAEKATIVDASV